jgi:hypothetical protein
MSQREMSRNFDTARAKAPVQTRIDIGECKRSHMVGLVKVVSCFKDPK